MGYVAYNLTAESRAMLLEKFPPLYANVVCHHVTIIPTVDEPETLPAPARLRVVGYSCDLTGLEALIVHVDDQLHRPDGGVFHVTHSLAEGRAKVESNDVIEKFGWTALAEAIAVDAIPCWNE